MSQVMLCAKPCFGRGGFPSSPTLPREAPPGPACGQQTGTPPLGAASATWAGRQCWCVPDRLRAIQRRVWPQEQHLAAVGDAPRGDVGAMQVHPSAAGVPRQHSGPARHWRGAPSVAVLQPDSQHARHAELHLHSVGNSELCVQDRRRRAVRRRGSCSTGALSRPPEAVKPHTPGSGVVPCGARAATSRRTGWRTRRRKSGHGTFHHCACTRKACSSHRCLRRERISRRS